MRIHPIVFALAVLSPTAVLAQPFDRTYMDLDMVERPGKADIQAVMPSTAKTPAETPVVQLVCRIQADGRLDACNATDGPPLYQAAAIKLAPLYRIEASTAEELAGHGVIVPVYFGEPWREPEGPPPPPVLSVPPRATGELPVVAAPRPGAADPARIQTPIWLSQADEAQIGRAYPQAAHDAGIKGKATVTCLVATDGRLTDCSVVAESPADHGFGDAAVRLRFRYRLAEEDGEGKPTAGKAVRYVVEFKPLE